MSQVSLIGAATTVNQFDTLSYFFKWSGAQATNGSISIQASLDGITYWDLDFLTTISTDGVSGTHQLLITKVSFNFARPVYTRVNAGATGSLSVELFATGVGA